MTDWNTKAATDERVAALQAVNDDLAQKLGEMRSVMMAYRYALALAASQAEDDGLWFVAETAPEAYLQQELRRLHAALEST